MSKGFHIGTASKREGSLAMAVGQMLALLIYFLLLEQYGCPVLDLDGDEHVIEAALDSTCS
jgi:hypothetical protein